MYDRFIMRLSVNPVKDVDNFKKLIVDKDIEFDANIDEDNKISTEEWKELKIFIDKIQVPENILNIIMYIKNDIEKYNEINKDKAIYISDRRWKNILYILKTAAYFSDRDEILPVDCFLISHCIWTLEENIDEVKTIVKKAIENFSQINRDEFENINNEIETLRKDINIECINQEDIYETENINGIECCKIKINYKYSIRLYSKDLYIPIGKINTNNKFYPMLNDGTEFKYFICYFNGNTVLKVKSDSYSYALIDNNKQTVTENKTPDAQFLNILIDNNKQTVTKIEKSLPIKSKKGTFKTITSITKENYLRVCDELVGKIDNAIKASEEDLEKQRNKIDSPFVNEYDREIILKSYEDYISDFKSKRLDVEQEKNKIEECETTD